MRQPFPFSLTFKKCTELILPQGSADLSPRNCTLPSDSLVGWRSPELLVWLIVTSGSLPELLAASSELSESQICSAFSECVNMAEACGQWPFPTEQTHCPPQVLKCRCYSRVQVAFPCMGWNQPQLGLEPCGKAPPPRPVQAWPSAISTRQWVCYHGTFINTWPACSYFILLLLLLLIIIHM